MIHNWDKYTLAVLADNGTVLTAGGNPLKWSSIDALAGLAIKHICSQGRVLAVLTEDNRILVCIHRQNRLEDITPTVHKVFGRAVDIVSIYVYYPVLVIIAMDGIGLIHVQPSEKTSSGLEIMQTSRVLCCFPSEVNLWAVDQRYNWGFVRTNDNSLHWFGHSSGSEWIMWPTPAKWVEYPVEFDNTANIKELHSSTNYMYLLMHDGSVYAKRTPHDKDRQQRSKCTRFEQLEISQSIDKIVTTAHDIFFITVEGACYHSKVFRSSSMIDIRLLQCLDGCVVENVYALLNDYIVQHDGSKLSILHVSPHRGINEHNQWSFRCETFKGYAKGTIKPIPWPFFDDKPIVSVHNLTDRAYLITDEGHAYWISDIDESTEPTVTRDVFFDANPIAVKKGMCMIRSALMCFHQSS